jgi:large subunit ribosomal protein L29
MGKEARELRELTDDVLVDRLAQAKADLWSRRLALATGQLDDTAEIPKFKREIARISTLMREREIQAHETRRREA